MNINIRWQIGACLRWWRIAGLAGILAILLPGARAGGVIDFSYKITPGGTRLTQVYDDGTRTYLVLAKDNNAGAITEIPKSAVATRDGKVYSAMLNASAPHLSIMGVYDRIVLTVGGRRTIATYVGSRERQDAGENAATARIPLVEVGEPGSIRKTPVQEIRVNPPQEAMDPGDVQATDQAPIAAVPPDAFPPPPPPNLPPPPAIQPAPASLPAPPLPPARQPTPAGPASADAPRELPNRQIVRVEAGTAALPPASAPPRPVAEAVETVRASDDQIAEYKVMVPFAMGKTALGKEGEKAMAEVAQIGPIAREIRIRAPGDPGRNLDRAHSRAAEIHRLLVKAGLVRQRISIEAVDAVPDGKVVNAEVALIVDLAGRGRK